MVRDPGHEASRWEPHLLRLVDEVAGYAIFLLDPEGRVVTWNRGAEQLKGYAPEEIRGRHFSVFYTQEDVVRDHPAHELAVARDSGRYEEEGWRLRRDGTRFWASVVITAVHDADGTLVGFGKVTRDLTEHRRAEEQLRRFEELVTQVRDYAIFLLDPQGHVTTWNEGARRIKGYSAEEIVGQHFSRFYPDGTDGATQALEQALAEGRFQDEQWRVRRDGSRFWASVVITPLHDHQGELTGFAKITRDLTERRIAEQELTRLADQAAEEARELEAFAAAAAHDLQEPLRTVAGFAELLARRHAEVLPEEGRRFLGEIEAAVARMSELISSLLDHARFGARDEQLERVRVREIAHDVLAAVSASAAERGVEVALDVPDGASVLADTRGLRLLLQNLVSNAVKFADAAGPHVALDVARRDEGWALIVEDNGPGIPPERADEVFEPFVRLHPGRGGTGLGLAIAQRIAERHGTRIRVTTRPGGGARFSLTLPAG